MYKVGLRNDVKSFSNEVFCSNKGYLFSRTLKFNLFIKIQTKTALLTRSLVYCYIVCNEKFKKLILTKLTLFFFRIKGSANSMLFLFCYQLIF